MLLTFGAAGWLVMKEQFLQFGLGRLIGGEIALFEPVGAFGDKESFAGVGQDKEDPG